VAEISELIFPLGDRVVIDRILEAEKTTSGLYIPQASVDYSPEGTVVAVGPGKVLENGTLSPTLVKVGQKVSYSRYTGNEIRVEGKDYLVVSESTILAVLA
jgi:chaperonin GroES